MPPEVTDTEPKKENRSAVLIAALAGMVDKLTDPIELMIRKFISAKFLIAVGTTFFYFQLCLIILEKNPGAAPVILATIGGAWSTIYGVYFGASMRKPDEDPKK